MTWIERLEGVKLQITTGDKKIYSPLWRNAVKNINYNTEGFDFAGLQGTYVSRKARSGRQFPILLYFQGENCIEEAEAFEISANDPRPWQIKHPFFDDLLIQPLDLVFDYSDYNLVKVTGTLWETITTKEPTGAASVKKEVENVKSNIDFLAINTITLTITQPDIGLINPLTLSVADMGKKFEKLAVIAEDIKKIKDAIRAASGAAQNILNDVNGYITKSIALINMPFEIVQTIKFKVLQIRDSINAFFDILDPSDSQESAILEANASALLANLAYIAVNPGSLDYNTRSEVAEIFDLLSGVYTDTLENFDNNGIIQGSDLASQLDLIINLALANLFDIAQNARQERRIFIDKDENIVNLAHKYYGPGDENFNKFIAQNNISRLEYLGLQKGREITYFT